MAATEHEGLSGKFGQWTALYATYLFLAGWAYLRSYFGVFGVDTGWLDLGLNDTIAQGFSVLFGAGAPLTFVYLTILVLSLGIEVFKGKHSRKVDVGVACCLALMFPVTFWVTRYAGVTQANTDRGDKTSLPTITFTAGQCSYRGKVVYVKTESLYIHGLAYLEEPMGSVVCPFDLNGLSLEIPQLWLVRSGDLKDIRVVHYPKEAKPWSL